MPVKSYRPTSPAKRQMSVADYSVLTKKKPEKKLVSPSAKSGGRNSYGRITVRRIGGGNKQKLRQIDWKRTRDGIPARVVAIEYDPNRTAYIALIQYADGVKSYILAPSGLRVGSEVVSGPGADVKPGNAMALSEIPIGTVIHNVELQPGRGGQLARTAGAEAQLTAREGRYAHVRLPSGEVRRILSECRATVGAVGNQEHENTTIGKAGKSRHRGMRPSVRGVAMNPNDHPHGGGEGRSPIGMPSPLSPWGKKTLGKKTRKRSKKSNEMIVTARRRRRK